MGDDKYGKCANLFQSVAKSKRFFQPAGSYPVNYTAAHVQDSPSPPCPRHHDRARPCPSFPKRRLPPATASCSFRIE